MTKSMNSGSEHKQLKHSSSDSSELCGLSGCTSCTKSLAEAASSPCSMTLFDGFFKASPKRFKSKLN